MKLLEINRVKISWLRHASVLIEWDEKTLFIDPYEVNVEKKADIILITHEHFDHCDLESIEKVSKEGTIVIAPKDCLEKIPESIKKIEIKPGEIKEEPIFVLGDHLGLPRKEKRFIKKNCEEIISLGNIPYFSSQCIAIINHYLDKIGLYSKYWETKEKFKEL